MRATQKQPGYARSYLHTNYSVVKLLIVQPCNNTGPRQMAASRLLISALKLGKVTNFGVKWLWKFVSLRQQLPNLFVTMSCVCKCLLQQKKVCVLQIFFLPKILSTMGGIRQISIFVDTWSPSVFGDQWQVSLQTVNVKGTWTRDLTCWLYVSTVGFLWPSPARYCLSARVHRGVQSPGGQTIKHWPLRSCSLPS